LIFVVSQLRSHAVLGGVEDSKLKNADL